MKSKFKSDLSKEQKLGLFLDTVYAEKFDINFQTHRIIDKKRQLSGIDLEIHDCRKRNDVKIYFVDEKAQLDYLNKSLPTFAFELSYLKKGKYRKGWLIDEDKEAAYYFLITDIQTDDEGEFESCKITSVNRRKLLKLLEEKGLTPPSLKMYDQTIRADKRNGKTAISELNASKEGYIFYSHSNKAEKPINLVLKLNYLVKMGIGKII
jgi:hypothetical protein